MHTDDTPNLADPIESVANALSRLGTGNACTEMGALELLSMEVKDGTVRIADALSELAEAVNKQGDVADAINDLAEAIRQHGCE